MMTDADDKKHHHHHQPDTGEDEDEDGSNDVDDDNLMGLLDKVQDMLRVESALTRVMDRVAPWLKNNKGSETKDPPAAVPFHPRVRPVPQSMAQAQQVLAYARILSNRTSAPARCKPRRYAARSGRLVSASARSRPIGGAQGAMSFTVPRSSQPDMS